MARKIALAVTYPLHHRGAATVQVLRFAVVAGSALAVIMAGPALPL